MLSFPLCAPPLSPLYLFCLSVTVFLSLRELVALLDLQLQRVAAQIENRDIGHFRKSLLPYAQSSLDGKAHPQHEEYTLWSIHAPHTVVFGIWCILFHTSIVTMGVLDMMPSVFIILSQHSLPFPLWVHLLHPAAHTHQHELTYMCVRAPLGLRMIQSSCDRLQLVARAGDDEVMTPRLEFEIPKVATELEMFAAQMV